MCCLPVDLEELRTPYGGKVLVQVVCKHCGKILNWWIEDDD